MNALRNQLTVIEPVDKGAVIVHCAAHLQVVGLNIAHTCVC